MPLRPDMEPLEFLEILRRRKWVILFSFLLILFGAIVYCVLVQDVYKSSTKIAIIPPTVAEGMVRTTQEVSTRDRLEIIQQEFLSSSRLMEVINQIGHSRLGFVKGGSEEGMLEKMRSGIVVQFERNEFRNINTLTLSFEHESPRVAMDVASRLASFFIGENIRTREAVAQETSSFLTSQVEETRKKLEVQEDRIKRYKIQYGGELPQQELANQSRLQRLQDQIKSNRDAVARLEDRKIFMQTQISELEGKIRQVEQNPWDTTSASSPSATPNKLFIELAIRRKKLEEMNEKYTPLHPSVVQARWEVEKLEAKIAKLRQAAKNAAPQSAGVANDPSSSQDTADLTGASWERGEVRRIREQVGAMNLEIAALKRESVNAVRTIEDIQRKVERLPQREQEMVSLTRDYNNVKRSYDELLEKKLKATMGETLEAKQKGERFQILEPAILPIKPIKPNRLRVLGLALIASLLIGAGGSIGYEMMDPTLRGTKDFKSFFDIPILACLPVIQDDRTRRQIAVRRAAVVGGLVSILCAYVVFLVIYGQKVQSILQSLGPSTGGGN
jgi:polysaccharide chain length determinant protein (PEP-CTERM system associated)